MQLLIDGSVEAGPLILYYHPASCSYLPLTMRQRLNSVGLFYFKQTTILSCHHVQRSLLFLYGKAILASKPSARHVLARHGNLTTRSMPRRCGEVVEVLMQDNVILLGLHDEWTRRSLRFSGLLLLE